MLLLKLVNRMYLVVKLNICILYRSVVQLSCYVHRYIHKCNSSKMGMKDLPDVYLCPKPEVCRPKGWRHSCISGKSQVHMLQLTCDIFTMWAYIHCVVVCGSVKQLKSNTHCTALLFMLDIYKI